MNTNTSVQPKQLTRFDDLLLLGIMAALAACGLIYEYLLSHYAGRILGALEAAIYTMIGLMIVSMGFGAFAARKIRHAFTGFACLELLVALCGASAILITAAIIGFSAEFPQILAQTFNLPQDHLPDGGSVQVFQSAVKYLPYVWGTLLGLMIGMEIPLIARVRQDLSDEHLLHNAGTIYGADYIGAGIGAAIWVGIMLAMDIELAASITASVNLIAGFLFLFRFKQRIRHFGLLLSGHIIAALVLLALAYFGPDWQQGFNNLLYKDKVVYTKATRFQQLTFTERLRGQGLAPVFNLYINGRLQFSSEDEHIYHSFLVHPTLAASARHDKVLIIGGGDGLGLKQVLKWQPQQVTLMDLDSELIKLFSRADTDMPKYLNQTLRKLNSDALNDPRVNIILNDAFNGVETLIKQQAKFDAIIVDLPDPSHPDLNKLYSDVFYLKLKQLLSADGAMTVQSTSPYHAQHAFISVGKTIALAGFNVQQYHHNVPSFGEWGFSIATVTGKAARQRLAELKQFPIDEQWLTPALARAAFEFPGNFYQNSKKVKPNRLGSLQLYRYHLADWSQEQGQIISN
ncbi:MAG: polyamine aminopropyltransferase [Parashewanella sp.]